MANPNVPSPSQHQAAVPEEKSAAVEDDVEPVTSESEVSSDSSSRDATG